MISKILDLQKSYCELSTTGRQMKLHLDKHVELADMTFATIVNYIKPYHSPTEVNYPININLTNFTPSEDSQDVVDYLFKHLKTFYVKDKTDPLSHMSNIVADY